LSFGSTSKGSATATPQSGRQAPVLVNTAETTTPTVSPSKKNPDLNSEWARKNTSVAPDFLERFYKKSRLHFLSTWKKELQDMTRKILEEQQEKDDTEIDNAKGPLHDLINTMTSFSQCSNEAEDTMSKPDGYRCILHVDMDCFFASVSLLDQPQLSRHPVAISHTLSDGVQSTSEIGAFGSFFLHFIL
jgi:DNA repair protein REV1